MSADQTNAIALQAKFQIDVWTLSLANPAPTHLSEDEIARANRFKFEQDRVRWARARSAMRLILSRYAGEDPMRLTFIYGKHGKPELSFAHIEFNLSHAGEWAMLAVTRGPAVGVDIERIRENVDMSALLRRLGETDLPESTQDLYQRWTVREAKSKAAGGALFDKPLDNVSAVELEAPAGYAAAVALVGYQ